MKRWLSSNNQTPTQPNEHIKKKFEALLSDNATESVVSNKQPCSYGIQQTNQTLSQPNEPIQKDI
ncbi:hypothetical protein HWQ46_25980 [Shewanella sp. D64]|uniref:hypothetical protein n=1 Tax=unclassified Shewanella TaxID=196818 RepID=UPI0022BA5664|nr:MULTISPECIES: hypothetical protein [unclassified Shewanella]MEC4728967.1 hypothetical protein [Shewanella sp. D64]MEC4740802.1 hypothetical protein [Shewanella sp. E94]WBJ96684.1 hypothetical protein HWQ47_06090 [Shewanella sp. MTB7]